MTTNNTTRRHFLTAGAMLATASLILPSTVTAETPSITPASAAPDLAGRIAAVLDARNVAFYGEDDRWNCQCGRCRALRRRVRECEACGYTGPFLVEACDCRATRAEGIPFCRAKIAAGKDTEYYREELARMLAIPDSRCKAHPDPDTKEMLDAWPGPRHCHHGSISCPTCGNYGESDDVPCSASDLAGMIRKVRAILTTA